MNKYKTVIDDGFYHKLVAGADFDGIFEIPHIPAPKAFIIPDGMIPFSQMKQSKNNNEFVVFYEHDFRFRDIITSTDEFIDELKKFPGVISPDCSLYRDMPLSLQITNVYISRAVGFYTWKNGIYTIPNIRWGDERSYTTKYFKEPFAFLGVEKHSIVSIGTYGCIKNKQNIYHFKNGLSAMLDYLEPEVVLVYGSMPDDIFGPHMNRTIFIQYTDWMSHRKKKISQRVLKS